MKLTKEICHIILGALTVAQNRGNTGILEELIVEDYNFALIDLIEKLYVDFPFTVEEYAIAKRILNNES